MVLRWGKFGDSIRISSNGDMDKKRGDRHADEPANKLKGSGKIIQEERMQKGQIKLDVVLSWCKAGGLLLMILYCVCSLLTQLTTLWSRLWIRFWTADPILANTTLSHTQKYAETNWFYVEFMFGYYTMEILLGILSQIFYWIFVVRAATNLHRGMLAGVLKSPMSFFDTTPTGRMLNRFAEDIDIVDINYPWSFVIFTKLIGHIVGTIVVVAIMVPLFTTTSVPIVFIFYGVVVLYLPTARQLKRMDAVAKSPIYSHLSEAVGGVSTIRAFGHTSRFSRDLRSKIDDSIIRSLTLQSCTSWLTLVTDLLGESLMFSAAIFAVLSSGVDAGATGLAIFLMSEHPWLMGLMVFHWMELTSKAVSIERVVEYSQLIPEEQHYERPSPNSWPSQGRIEFKDFKVKYRDELDLSLKGVNAAISPGEKIGIVGRTGAGKSTMTLALFRLIEAAGGAIYIDKVNIADLPLSTLRSRLSILPQDPVLFSGTLHMNVDPHNEYTVDEVRRALVRAHLGEVVMYEEAGLSFYVGEQGNNLSVGQRQLVCLARALLRQNKILVLDEATAAIDVQTDTFIQETIRTDFRDCTVLTIAHRINTIMDYDRVMVLENGEVKEFAPIQDLLSNPDSLFYSLAKEAKLV